MDHTNLQRIHHDVWHGNNFHNTCPLGGNSPVIGGSSSQRASSKDFNVFSLNKQLNKHSISHWFQMLWSCHITVMDDITTAKHYQYVDILWNHGNWKCNFNTLRLRQNGRYFADDTFKCIFFNENAWISLKISLKFVPKVQINNIPALIQIMAWRRPGDKPLSETNDG